MQPVLETCAWCPSDSAGTFKLQLRKPNQRLFKRLYSQAGNEAVAAGHRSVGALDEFWNPTEGCYDVFFHHQMTITRSSIAWHDDIGSQCRHGVGASMMRSLVHR